MGKHRCTKKMLSAAPMSARTGLLTPPPGPDRPRICPGYAPDRRAGASASAVFYAARCHIVPVPADAALVSVRRPGLEWCQAAALAQPAMAPTVRFAPPAHS